MATMTSMNADKKTLTEAMNRCLSFVLCDDVFFFQAEDGIRDYKVTGVQTCALPIWSRWGSCGPGGRQSIPDRSAARAADAADGGAVGGVGGPVRPRGRPASPEVDRRQIGRASCRERG